jgi:hypothetical protein
MFPQVTTRFMRLVSGRLRSVSNDDAETAALRYWALDRDHDASGVSGTGRVAYAIELVSGVLLLWDAGGGHTVDWRPSMAALRAIHGHGGATRLTPLDDDPAARQRAIELLRQLDEPARMTFDQARELLRA